MIDLRLGDCLEILPTLPDASVDSVITDPPYGVQVAGWDKEIPPQKVLTHCLRISRGSVIWFGAAPVRCIASTMQYEPPPDRMIVWHLPFSLAKTSANGMYYRWHPIWCWRLPKKQEAIWKDIIECSQDGHNEWKHPGTKPLKLMLQLVNAFGGKSVLDPFFGSGTTAVACLQTDRDFIGIEISEEYHAIAQRRIADAQLQLRMEF